MVDSLGNEGGSKKTGGCRRSRPNFTLDPVKIRGGVRKNAERDDQVDHTTEPDGRQLCGLGNRGSVKKKLGNVY